MLEPQWLVIHCSAAKGSTLESMRRFHTAPKPKGKGWKDVGYHFVIEEDGAIRRGRPLTERGAHAKGKKGMKGPNDVGIGICLAGTGSEPFTWAQEMSAQRLCLALMLVYGIPVERVIGHREVMKIPGAAPTTKSCPGVVFDLDWFRDALSERSLELQGGGSV